MSISLSAITGPSVLQAIVRYDELGQRAFFDEYHFSHALEYFVVKNGKDYDSKAIAGVAHGFATGDFKQSDDFSGGKPVAARLRQLGFEVTEKSDWTPTENEATVASYLSMLKSELAGVPFNKSAENTRLREQLHSRSHKAVEFKYQNISAVLADNNLLYIDGYKPATHIQRSLRDEVVRQVSGDDELDGLMAARAAEAATDVPIPVTDEFRVVQPPKVNLGATEWRPREVGIRRDYAHQDAVNRKLGLAGEVAIVAFEKKRLVSECRADLADRVVHESVTRGDGLGYDVRSFNADGTNRFIEVKTTIYGREAPFFVSRYEVAASEYFDSGFFLYRVFRFGSKEQGMYHLRGPLSGSCDLRAETLVGAPHGGLDDNVQDADGLLAWHRKAPPENFVAAWEVTFNGIHVRACRGGTKLNVWVLERYLRATNDWSRFAKRGTLRECKEYVADGIAAGEWFAQPNKSDTPS